MKKWQPGSLNMSFSDLIFHPMDEQFYGKGAIQACVEYKPECGMSIVRHDFSYGGHSGLYEIAHINKGSVVHAHSPIPGMEDEPVRGYMSEADVSNMLTAFYNYFNL